MRTSQSYPALAIHGGAGDLPANGLSPRMQAEILEALNEISLKAFRILQTDGNALDAVEDATRLLENCRLFNAGVGAAFTELETHELDAAIMCGKKLQAGSASVLRHVKNPIKLARAILEERRHVMLSGSGAEKFAEQVGLEIVPNCYFSTYDKLKELWQFESCQDQKKVRGKGTAGAVALDAWGNLAAATSTGGLTGKMAGRIGDSPVIGAGTYADNRTCAVSCTGDGEFLVRVAAAHELSSLLMHQNLPLAGACKIVMEQLIPFGGDAGLLALDKHGNFCFPHNSQRFYRAWIRSGSKPRAALF